MNNSKILLTGKIAKQVSEYAKTIIKKDVPLLEIAEKIEGKIIELGGKPAFPVNLAIDEIAAHYTPSHDDETKAHGLLKIDLGVHVDGWIADTAFSLSLEDDDKTPTADESFVPNKSASGASLVGQGGRDKNKTFQKREISENKKLIQASEKALENAIKIFQEGKKLNEVGKTISETIEAEGFSPIINLSGHEIDEYDLHAGVTVPNIDDNRNTEIEKSLYAIEPFATTGSGKVHDGKPSGIYMLVEEKNIRSPIAREILEFILEEYQTLPFCSRWLVKKFGTKALLGLKQLEGNGNLHHFAQLVESRGAKVSQAEHTVLVGEEGSEVTTY